MVQYNSSPQRFIETSFGKIASFISHESFVNDEKTIQSFAEEWNKFGFFSDVEITTAGLEYFDIINDVVLNRDSVILDIGCGSGRWSKYLSGRVKFIEAMDAGNAVFAAQQFLHNNRKIRVTQAPAINIPFPDNSFDFIMSLGVFHHMHDTQNALNHSVTKIKPGGYYLLYLYYNFDNRPFIYKFLFFFR